MIEVELNHGLKATIDDEDQLLVIGYRWCVQRPAKDCIYAVTNIKTPEGNKGMLSMHRLVMNAPTGMVVDHIDFNGLNNCKANLRICTRGRNAGRQRPQKNRSSQYKGVHYFKSGKRRKRWVAGIHHNGKCHKLGYFDLEEDAARAYNEAALAYHGEFALLNEIKEIR